jgi:hypothetical protein
MGSYAAGDERGFLLIATRRADQWARSQLLTFDRDFVIGLQFDSRLAVNFCTGCSTGGLIEWSGSAYEFMPYPPKGVPGIERWKLADFCPFHRKAECPEPGWKTVVLNGAEIRPNR